MANPKAAETAAEAGASEPTRPDFPARRGEANMAVGYTTTDGSQRELQADSKGWFHPVTAEDEAVLRNSFGFLTPSESDEAADAQKAIDAAAVATGAPETAPAGEGV